MIPLNIHMDMNLDNLPETLVNGVVTYPPPYQSADPQWFTAWHYHGTMAHGGDMRVVGKQRVYTGDAGALMTSFNCHTSMPAAAAGVAAVRGWAGQQLDPTIKVPTYESADAKQRPAWIVALFLAGSWLLVLGVAAHVAGRVLHSKPIKTAHYALMLAGSVVLWAAAISVAARRRSKVAATAHRYLGYGVLSAITLQAAAGIVAAWKNSHGRRSVPLGVGHRVAGWCILAAVVALAWTAAQGAASYDVRAKTVDRHAVALTLVAAATAVDAIVFIWWRPCSPGRQGGKGGTAESLVANVW